MLPLAFAWAQDNIQRSKRDFPAVMMVERFVEILQAEISPNSTIVLNQVQT